MYKKTSYSDLLRDPRWQKRRLEVMQRDNFACQNCGDDASTLNVHHLKYHGAPWDTPPELLITLCESCHEHETLVRPQNEKELLAAIKEKGFFAHSVTELTNGFRELKPFHAPEVMASVISWALRNHEVMKELEDKFFSDLSKSKPF